MSLKEILESARERGDFSAFVDAIPYARFLGLTVRREGESLITTMTFSPMLVGNATIPALHGGTIGGLVESAAVFQLLYEADQLVLPKIINVTVDYLRSARAVDTHATGIITKQGRRVTSVRAVAWQEDRDKPIATASAHYLVGA
ncbi:MAG: PaaI family thioesterase [Myxococcales bacterium]|nr:PaaI family thioesterase [Myxococcales bacterium]